jgi:hypothetical protein
MPTTIQQPEQIILAGDMALRFGLAIGSTTRGYLASTVIDVNEQRHGTSLARGVKFAQMKTRLWVQRQGIQLVNLIVYEEPTTSRGNPLPQYAMVTGLILAGDDLGCWANKSYWPITLKKFSTGNHKADKYAMMRAAGVWSQRAMSDDNEADAVLLLKLTLAELSGEYVRPKKKRKLSKRQAAKKEAAIQPGLF